MRISTKVRLVHFVLSILHLAPLWNPLSIRYHISRRNILIQILQTLAQPRHWQMAHTKTIFSAFLDRRYCIGALAVRSSTVPVFSTCCSCPGIGKIRCKNSYAARVHPNWGLLLIILAGPPLKNARSPSSRQIVTAACRILR